MALCPPSVRGYAPTCDLGDVGAYPAGMHRCQFRTEGEFGWRRCMPKKSIGGPSTDVYVRPLRSVGPDCHDARSMCEGIPCAAEVRPFAGLLCPDLCLCCVSTPAPRPRGRIFWGGRRSKSMLVHIYTSVLGMHSREKGPKKTDGGYAPTCDLGDVGAYPAGAGMHRCQFRTGGEFG